MKVNEAVRCIRKDKGVTQVHVATQLGISIQTYNGYELGRRQIKADLLKEIARVLNEPVENFFNYGIYETKNEQNSKEII